MKNYIFTLTALMLISLSLHAQDPKKYIIKITLPDGESKALSIEKIQIWFNNELKTFSTPLTKIDSLSELFEFVITAKKQGFLPDIKLSIAHILIDQLNDAIRREEQLLKVTGQVDAQQAKINNAKNLIKELEDTLRQEK